MDCVVRSPNPESLDKPRLQCTKSHVVYNNDLIPPQILLYDEVHRFRYLAGFESYRKNI